MPGPNEYFPEPMFLSVRDTYRAAELDVTAGLLEIQPLHAQPKPTPAPQLYRLIFGQLRRAPHVTTPKPLTKRQRRRLRGKGKA